MASGCWDQVKLSGPHQGFKDHVERYRYPGDVLARGCTGLQGKCLSLKGYDCLGNVVFFAGCLFGGW